jgi:hypothetical protein
MPKKVDKFTAEREKILEEVFVILDMFIFSKHKNNLNFMNTIMKFKLFYIFFINFILIIL